MIFVTKSGLCPHYWGFQQKQKKNKALENLPQNRESFSEKVSLELKLFEKVQVYLRTYFMVFTFAIGYQ